VVQLLRAGATVDAESKKGFTALIVASREGHRDVVVQLLDAGANVNAKNNAAVANAFVHDHRNVVEVLLENGANPNTAFVLPGRGRTATPMLMRACETGDLPMVELLLYNGADPNMGISASMNPLHVAIRNSNIEMLRLLIDAGVFDHTTRAGDIEFTTRRENYDLDNTISFALITQNLEIVLELMRYSPPVGQYRRSQYYKITPDLANFLMDSVLDGSVDVNAGIYGSYGKTLLHILIEKFTDFDALYGMVEMLLEKGADPNIQDPDGVYPLFSAISDLRGVKNTIAISELLLNANADPNLLNKDGENVLFSRYWTDDELPFLEKLIEHGADPTLISKRGYTVLTYNADDSNEDDIVEIVRLFIKNGVPLDQQPDRDKVALSRVIFNKDAETLVPMLLDAGANPNIKLEGVYTDSPLTDAVNEGNINVVTLLIERGANVNVASGVAPLMMALYWGFLDIGRLLIENGADISKIQDAPDGKRMTPLMQVTKKVSEYLGLTKDKKLDFVRFLLENGADITLKNKEGQTAEDIAKENGYTEIVKLLRLYKEKGEEMVEDSVWGTNITERMSELFF